MSPIMVYLIVGIVCAILAIRMRNRTLNAAPTIVLFALVICLGYTVLSQQRDEADRRAKAAEVADTASCIARVERSEGNREMWEYVIELLSANSSEAVDGLRNALDTNLPQLDRKDCAP